MQDRDGRWYSLRVRPYRTLENKIDGAVLVLVDVDALKRNEETLRRQTELLDQAHEPIVMWELGGRHHLLEQGAEEVYGYTEEQAHRAQRLRGPRDAAGRGGGAGRPRGGGPLDR